jgi:hypothetical protein
MRTLLLDVLFASLVFLAACNSTDYSNDPTFQKAIENGKIANQGFKHCNKFVTGWLNHADSLTGLIPKNLGPDKDYWNAQDAAADNYPFMVLTAAILNKGQFEGVMLDMLNTERTICARIGKLPDTYSFSKQGFLTEKIDTGAILFGASEYMKDGLMPLTEWLGFSPWFERMRELLDAFQQHAEVVKKLDGHYFGNSPVMEINGELLQVLSRMYWYTQNQKYLDWAIKIGDYYLLGDNLPTNKEYLRLRDHGCEIVSGLSELYATLHFVNPEKKETYKIPMYEMMDKILNVGINEHGFIYDGINGKTNEVTSTKLADTWGYTYDAYYTIYLIDKKKEYRDAVLKPLNNIMHYENYNWEGNNSSDGYADAIESALNLYNREPIPVVADWMDHEIKEMWAIQKEDGVIEGWHGDGNFARTTIMYCLWKTKGVTIDPWRDDVVYGAEIVNDELRLSITCKNDWTGKIVIDKPRHSEIMHLPIDYPRINQFPEWFTAETGKEYKLISSSGKDVVVKGEELTAGYEITLKENETRYLIIKNHK